MIFEAFVAEIGEIADIHLPKQFATFPRSSFFDDPPFSATYTASQFSSSFPEFPTALHLYQSVSLTEGSLSSTVNSAHF